MMQAMENTSFISGFHLSAEHARREWLTLAAAGRDPGALENTLAARLYEGVAVKPLYTRADSEALAGSPGRPPFVRGAPIAADAPPWLVIQPVDPAGGAAANAQIKEDLAEGARALSLEFERAPWFGGVTDSPVTLDAMLRLFEGVELSAPHFYGWGGRAAIAGAAALIALGARRGVAPAALRGSAGFDPLSEIAISGEVPLTADDALASSVDAAIYLMEHKCGLRPFLASGRPWRMAGGSAVHELAYALAAAVSYWRALNSAGADPIAAVNATALRLTADADLFVTIAKFRAARAIWARAIEAAELPVQAPVIIAETSFGMMSAFDPYVNLLRNTAAVFGAGLGGAEAVLALPFDACAGGPDSFSLRMARNAQLILQEESHLGWPADPAGGSWFIESLTAELAASAWSEFRQVEAQGGLLAALANGYAAERLRPVREAQKAAIARGQEKLTGVNSFPNLDEEPPPERVMSTTPAETPTACAAAIPPAGRGERFAALIAAMEDGAAAQNLAAALRCPARPVAALAGRGERLAGPFEKLRRASNLALARDGARPRVFLANIGGLAEFGASSAWTKNFFAAGGIEAIGDQGFDNPDDLASAFRASGVRAACLCLSEKKVAAMAEAARALRAAGASQVFLTLRPAAAEKLSGDDRSAIDRLIHEGCDMLAILREFHADSEAH
jgi:methylmalonyl-CoA mutase